MRFAAAGRLTVCIALTTAVAQAQDAAVRVNPTHRRVADDPAVNPSSTKPPPTLPAKARAQKPREERETQRSSWQNAAWTHASLDVRSGAAKRKTVNVSAPSTVVVRASWKGAPALAVTVRQQGNTLATAKGAKRPDGELVATAEVSVPAAGPVVVEAADSSGRSSKVDLYVGVLAAGH